MQASTTRHRRCRGNLRKSRFTCWNADIYNPSKCSPHLRSLKVVLPAEMQASTTPSRRLPDFLLRVVLPAEMQASTTTARRRQPSSSRGRFTCRNADIYNTVLRLHTPLRSKVVLPAEMQTSTTRLRINELHLIFFSTSFLSHCDRKCWLLEMFFSQMLPFFFVI